VIGDLAAQELERLWSAHLADKGQKEIRHLPPDGNGAGPELGVDDNITSRAVVRDYLAQAKLNSELGADGERFVVKHEEEELSSVGLRSGFP
jgi:hypothetical protein